MHKPEDVVYGTGNHAIGLLDCPGALIAPAVLHSIHCIRLSGSRLPICKYGAVVSSQHLPHQRPHRRIIDG